MPSEVPRERLQDIVTNIDRVRAHLTGMKPDAKLDDKTRDAVERCLERISEAAKGAIPSRASDATPRGTPWQRGRGAAPRFGNVL
jgi:uncharacterized protein with HEPN domain